MEGNLNRARNSLIITPSTSIHSSSPLARSTPSPPARVVAQLGNQPLRHRQLGHSSLSSGHTRISSENSIPSPVLPVATSRTFLSGRPLDPSPRISAPVPKRQDSSDSFVSGRRSYSALQSRNSDPSTAATNQEGGSGSDGDIFNGHRSDRYVRAATAEPSYHHEIQHNGLERSASTTDMHDLTGKMSELKTKISTLRDKAREDMRRRSAQSLRTPSPFTAAEQWYTSSQDYRDGHLSADAGIAGNPWDRDSPSRDASPKDVLIVQNGQVNDQVFEYEPSEAETVYHEVEEVESNPSETYGNVMTSFGDADPLNKPGTPSDGEGSSGTERDDYAVDDDNESVYHDTLQVPAESHEDREDAFDYEHFFLHSAMGTMTRERMARRDSQGSYSSEDSVETTKALEPATDDYRDHLKDDPRGHHRQQSADTISTMASFATAQETFDDEEEDLINQYEESEAFPVIPLEQLQSAKQSAFSANQDAGRKTPQVVSRPTSVLSRATSVMRNGVSQPAPVHRPSISSMNSASTGITRSFSVKKPMTPTNGPSTAPTSPAQPVLDENGNELCGVAITTDNDDLQQAMPMSPNTAMLRRDEQILVERLMASMSKCVLALQESREGTVEHRLWRRRLDAARRVLEGIEGAV